ncbi:MAG: hypothetical protein AAGE52_34325 [Myxococcota bacterium]
MRPCSSAKSSISRSVLLLFVLGCGECSASDAEPDELSVDRTIERVIDAPDAFDFLVTSQGALLVLASERRIVGLQLARDGSLQREADLVAAEDVRDLKAAAGGGRLALGWETPEGLFASYGRDDGSAFSPARRIGSGGGLAIAAAPTGEAAILHRGEQGRCADGGEGCTEIHIQRLGQESERSGVVLALPAPCERPLVGYAHTGGVWYYGLCDASEGPLTTLYAIQFRPQYAHAEAVLPGCRPTGLGVWGDEVVVGGCTQPWGVRMGDAGQLLAPVAEAPTLRCRDGAPMLRVGEIERPLTTPQDDLEALVSSDGQVVWTGSALLRARTDETIRLSVERWDCEREAFVFR